MAHFLVIWLILTDVFVLLAAANERLAPHNGVGPNEDSFSKPPSPSPSLGKKVTAEAPVIRKLGKHYHKVANKPFAQLSLSPSKAPPVEHLHSSKEVSASDEETRFVLKHHQVEMKRKKQRQQHRSTDKSVVGGGVILGGLGATFLVAVFCYIRATGRRNAEPNA